MTKYSSIPNAENENEKDSTTIKTLFYSLVLISPFLLGGITMAYPAIALPQMKLDIGDASWFGSIYALLSPVGALLVGISIDKYGRRPALLLTVVPGTIGWLLHCASSAPFFILLAQVLNGITFGAIGYPSQVYAGECVTVNRIRLRNHFATWTGLTTSFGTFVTFLLGRFLRHGQIAAVAATLSLLCFFTIYAFVPESPTWLRLRGKPVDAQRSETKLGAICRPIRRNGHRQRIVRVEGLGCATEDDRPPSAVSAESAESAMSAMSAHLRKIARKDVYKPLAIMTLTFVMVFMAGGLTITTYMVRILQQGAKSGPFADGGGDVAAALTGTTVAASAYEYSVVSGGLIFAANFGASIVAMRVGVRRLTTFALFCAAIGMALMGYCAGTRAENGAPSSALHVLSVWLVAFMFNFGPVNVTWGTLGDVFPADGKGFASVCVTVAAVTMAASNKLFPYLVSAYGGSLYYVYAIITLVASIFCHFFLPETVGRTLDQINRTFL